MATNGGDVLASELMTALLTGEDVSIPNIDFSGSEYSIPGDINSDAYDVLVRLSDSDLTTGAINGTGAFDKLMVGVAAQLQGEYDAGRITGVEYTKAYIALTGSALSSSLQYLLSRDAAYWQAVQAQAASVTARVQLATAKIQNAAAQLEAMTTKANYALTKLKLSILDTEYATGQYNLENLLPSQLAQTNAQTSLLSYDLTTVKPAEVANLNKQGTLLDSQKLGQDAQNDTAIYNLSTVLPAQVAMTDSQKIGQDTANSISDYNLENLLPVQLATASAQKLSVDKANSISDYNLATVLPSQVAMTNAQKLGQDKQTETANYNLINLLPKQVDLLDEQIAGAVKDTETKTYTLDEIMPVQKLNLQEQAEAQRGQTMDTRSNGITPIAGSIGKQNSLYAQQVVSYQKDSQLKAAKVFSDVWITCRSIDEGFPLPKQFDELSVDYATEKVFQAVITANGLG